MGLNINNSNNRLSIFRMNGIYCAIIFIVHYIICLNLFINNYYYNEKQLRSGFGVYRTNPIDISDFHKYGPSFRKCISFLFDDAYANWVLLFLPLVVAIIAYVRMRRRPLTLKQFLKTDIFVWSFFSFMFIYKVFTSSSYYITYVINDRILNPILLFLMILFRYWQYKKYGVIKNGILSSTREMLYVIQQKVYNLVIRFNHKR